MTLSPGSRLGPYEIVAPLGAGGMGEVYRARDTKLGREVAIKVLPGRLAADADALSRFEREAKAVAALSHPNILSIFDFGEAGSVAYAVTELLEGETLRERLSVGALAARKTTDYAIQIANGLAAAHDRGIVHRDLKPDNVFVTKDGRVKILDFGLARQTAVSRADDTKSPTAAVATDAGTVLGTVGYMSPEQVRGFPADHRSDIFSFGVLLYEMVTGRRAFQRETAAETMTAILKEEPPEGGAAVSAPLDRILRHCLEKSPEERFQSARDLAFDLSSVAGVSGSAPAVAVGRGQPVRSRRTALAAVVGLAGGLLLGAALTARFRGPSEREPIRVRSLTFSGSDSDPSASPDGRMIAFTSRRDGVSRIWIKQLAGGGEAPLTSGPDWRPRFSPDGSSVLFLRGQGTTQTAYRIGVVGGEPRKLLDDVMEPDWAPDGRRIAFVRVLRMPERIHALGVLDLKSDRETVLLTQDREIFGPRWSPDGRSIAFTTGVRAANVPSWRLRLLDIATRRVRDIGRTGVSNPAGGIAWSGDGRELFFIQAGSLLGDLSGADSRVIRCDVATGRERTLLWAPGLAPDTGSLGPVAHSDVLGPGRLLFDQSLRWQVLGEVPLRYEAGERQVRFLTRGSSRDRQPAYSPDGKSIIFSSHRSGNLDLWLLNRETGGLRQITDDAAQDWDPGFTPNGNHILWSSDRGGHLEIWMANPDGSAARQVTTDGLDAENPTATPDGRWILYWSGNPEKRGVWRIQSDGAGAKRLVAGNLINTETSPDGRYVLAIYDDLANRRNTIRVAEVESGRVVPFQIVVAYRLGGPTIVWGRPRWAPDGRSLFYIGQDDAGLSGVFEQDFVPGRDTSGSRRPVAGFSPEYVTESLGVSPDGSHLTISALQESSSIMVAEGVPGALPPARKLGNP